MWKPSLCLAATLIATPAAAADLGHVTKALRPQLRTFDDKGQPLGTVSAADLKLPAPIVRFGIGNSVGVQRGDKVVFLRGLDVLTDNAKAKCAPVQTAARGAGTAYAASNMGLGGAADCQH
jgi:hypothetical protein